MRIVSGSLKGRQLSTQISSKTRPTTDKLRSSIFSILGEMDKYENILDAFAGTGAIGIEAFSRGAKHIDFIDKDINTLKINTKLMDKGSYNIYKGDFFKMAKSLNKQYDLIVFDPPYNLYSTKDILDITRECNLLKNDGIILFEEFYKTEFKVNISFYVYDERKYGDTIIRFLSHIQGE